MQQSIERNRARMFKTALEVLRDNITEVIAHCNYEIAPYSEEKAKEFEKTHQNLEDALTTFDDAIEAVAEARNEFAGAMDLEAQTLLLNWSNAKKGK